MKTDVVHGLTFNEDHEIQSAPRAIWSRITRMSASMPSASSAPCGTRTSGAKPVSARRPGERFDGIGETAQPINITPDRPAGHLEPVRELVARPVAASLEQGEQFQKAARCLAHEFLMVADIEDRS